MNHELMEFLEEIICRNIKDGAHLKDLDEYFVTHWVAWFCKRSEVVYFHRFGVQHVPKEIK